MMGDFEKQFIEKIQRGEFEYLALKPEVDGKNKSAQMYEVISIPKLNPRFARGVVK
jgi:hypothetical protein